MVKVAVNRCYGGFGISLAAARRMAELGHEGAKSAVAEYDSGRRVSGRWYGHDMWSDNSFRADPVLHRVLQEMGREAEGEYSAIELVEVPDDAEWQIDEYDGREWVAEKHRTW